MGALATVADSVLEATVVGSFSRLGCFVRARTAGWDDAAPPGSLAGRTAVVTGGSSGIGLAASAALARAGARVVMAARDQARGEEAARRVAGDATGPPPVFEALDLADFDAVRAFAGRHAEAGVDVLVSNAGALTRERRQAPDGSELTLAVHVLGPFLLTGLLAGAIGERGGRVVTVSSGGMYTQALDVDEVEVGEAGYDGRVAYARAKRAQVVLNSEWARRRRAVTFAAMHPGWVDTPGVDEGLPLFSRVAGPLLRSPAQGADTVVWLAASPAPAGRSGLFWMDRRPRSEHRVPWTRGGDPERLWRLCEERTGLTAGGAGRAGRAD